METEGVELLFNLAQYGVTGLIEILKQAKNIRRAFILIKNYLSHHPVDLIILIDYPGFNLRLAKFAHSLGIKVLYYISPQIWAWKANRLQHIKKYIHHMAVILPFEKEIYQRAEVPVTYVGHPLLKKIPSFENINQLKSDLHLPHDKIIIAMLPGSRKHEIEMLMPVMVKSMQALYAKAQDLYFILPVAKTISLQQVQAYFESAPELPYRLIEGKALELMAASDCVVVASGTASLECALLNKPMCIIYKASNFTYLIANKVMKVKYLGLANLLAGKMIVPELLQ